MESKPKIIAFTQLRNELEKGNLENWFRQLEICDYIYVYDQNSTDGSLEYYEKFDKLTVIKSDKNRFDEELICKQELLDKLLTEHPDVDWILWVDGDTLIDGRLLNNNGEELIRLCNHGTKIRVDGFLFEHYNLWRSDTHYRVDDQYHGLSGNLLALWRNNGKLKYNTHSGLHGAQYPTGLNKLLQVPFGFVHRGFATDYQIMTKYDVYKARGQNGWALERLLNEDGLKTVRIPLEYLPSWFELTDDTDPSTKERIREIYNKQKITQ